MCTRERTSVYCMSSVYVCVGIYACACTSMMEQGGGYESEGERASLPSLQAAATYTREGIDFLASFTCSVRRPFHFKIGLLIEFPLSPPRPFSPSLPFRRARSALWSFFKKQHRVAGYVRARSLMGFFSIRYNLSLIDGLLLDSLSLSLSLSPLLARERKSNQEKE